MIKGTGMVVLNLLLIAVWAGVSLAASGIEVGGDLTISNSGNINFPDGSVQVTSPPQVYSNDGQFIGVSLNGQNSIYIPFWKRVISLDLTSGIPAYTNFYYSGLNCTGTRYVNWNLVYSVYTDHHDGFYYSGDRLTAAATHSINSQSDSSTTCRNYDTGDCATPPCDKNSLIPAELMPTPPFNLPAQLPLTVE